VQAAGLDQHVEAVLAGQAEVEQDQVGGLVAQREQCLAAIAQPADGIGEAFQRALDRRAALGIVLDQDDVPGQAPSRRGNNTAARLVGRLSGHPLIKCLIRCRLG
jgi:hypothetical protein